MDALSKVIVLAMLLPVSSCAHSAEQDSTSPADAAADSDWAFDDETLGEVVFAAVSEATVFADRTIVDDHKINDFKNWIRQRGDAEPITALAALGVPSEDTASRQQIYVAIRADQIIDRSGFFVPRLYVRDAVGSVELKEVALVGEADAWSVQLTVRGKGTAGIDLMYCRTPEFREGRLAFPEVDINKPIAASYFDAYPIDVGNVKEPLSMELTDEWRPWSVRLGAPLLAAAKAVDDSLQAFGEIQRRFAPENAAKLVLTDSPWSAELLEAKNVESFMAELQDKLGPFQYALEIEGKSAVGEGDFVPDIRKKITIEASPAPKPAELWLRSLKEPR